MRISVSQKGDFKKTEKLLKKTFGRNYRAILEKYAKQGVQLLSDATPKDTGVTAACWDYEIIQNGSSLSIVFNNSNVVRGINIAIILQYGHATGGGGWVEGIDYINPALRPVFEKMADEVWKEVTKI